MASKFDKLMMAGLTAWAINNVASAYFSGFQTVPAESCRSFFTIKSSHPIFFPYKLSSPS